MVSCHDLSLFGHLMMLAVDEPYLTEVLLWIEFYWAVLGYSKWIYWLNPESSCEHVLEKNTVLAALESIPLKSMCKFANHSHRLMNSYMHGLNGRQVAWAARVYKEHQVVPMNIMEELGNEGIVYSTLHKWWQFCRIWIDEQIWYLAYFCERNRAKHHVSVDCDELCFKTVTEDVRGSW